MRIINILGEPSSGKSTIASEVFAMMKKLGYKVELVTEVVKDLVWEGHIELIHEQDYVFAMQHRRITRLRDKVDYIITDSPLLLQLFYLPISNTHKSFGNYIREVEKSFDNRYIFLERTHKFSDYGRIHDEHESKVIGKNLKKLLKALDIEYITHKSGHGVNQPLIKYILGE